MNAVDVAVAEVKELSVVLEGVDSAETTALVNEIISAGRIFVGGAGRTLLSMKTFAMRLMQIGFECYLVGEVCTPSIKGGDLLVVASHSGTTSVTLEVVRKAKSHGARTAVLTAYPGTPIPSACDCVVGFPLSYDSSDDNNPALTFSKLHTPGNIPEAAITLILDGVIVELMYRQGITGQILLDNHANLE